MRVAVEFSELNDKIQISKTQLKKWQVFTNRDNKHRTQTQDAERRHTYFFTVQMNLNADETTQHNEYWTTFASVKPFLDCPSLLEIC